MWLQRIVQLFLLAILVLATTHHPVVAQQKAAPKPAPKPGPAAAVAPAAPLKDGWEEIDKRLLFLMTRLANVEASLDAVEKTLGLNKRQQAAKAGDAKRAELGNEMMDRKGGGPVKWSQFYGRTAEKFFYHPTDRNTTYHTTTVLGQRSPVDDNQVEPGVPSRQGLPVHQRPPQFDYIYKANRDAQARAEQDAAQLRNKVDALQARRRQLEDEQAALWCQIAFRAVTRYDFARKPLFRFEPSPAATDTASRQQAEAVKAAAIFMRRGLSIVEEAEKDQGKAFGSIKTVIADANEKLDDSVLQLDTVVADASSQETAIGRFSALARRLKDIADNISDSYEVSIDGDRFKDELRKDTFRGLLQESLVDYAEVMLAMNEMALLMQSEAKSTPDVNTPLKFVSMELPERVVRPTEPVVPQDETPVPASTPAPQDVKWISLFDGKSLRGWKTLGLEKVHGWDVINAELVALPQQNVPLLLTEDLFGDFEFKCDFWIDSSGNSGIYLRGRYEVQLIDNGSYPTAGPENRCGAIVGQLAPIKPAYRGPRQWNTLVVRLERKTVTVVMNGTAVIDQRYIDKVTAESIDDLEDQPGPIAIQNRGGLVRFRDIEIRPLNAERSAVLPSPPPIRSTNSGPANSKPKNPSVDSRIIGTWIEKRPGTPVGDRIRTFSANGAFELSTPKSNHSVKGTWRGNSGRVYFSHPKQDSGTAEGWFEIVRADNEQIEIRMMGERSYIWINERSQPNSKVSVVGTFQVAWTENDTGTRGTVPYTFDAQGGVYKDGRSIGKWKTDADGIKIQFAQSERGHVIINSVNDTSFTGTHTWGDGKTSNWTGNRIK